MNHMAKKIMIVDDHALSRHVVRQVATTPQDTVLECISADEAVKAIGSFKPDCVMMGVSRLLPGAFQAIKAIRKSHPKVRVVAVSSFNEAELRQSASDAGAAGYVTTENLSELFLLAAPERLTVKPARHSKPRRKQK
jgi:DNA-binding NarL/FixJ family response regulator